MLNISEQVSVLSVQDGATRILQGQLQVSAGDMTEPLSAHNVTGIVRRHSLSANTQSVLHYSISHCRLGQKSKMLTCETI